MRKSILYRLFGLGKVPKRRLPVLQSEGIVLLDEGISGSMTLTKFRSPTRYSGKRWSSFAGALVLTKKRFVAFTMYPSFNPLIDIELSNERIETLEYRVERRRALIVALDARTARDSWSGHIKGRFETDLAEEFLRHLATPHSP